MAAAVERGEDTLLHQLQLIFSHLQESEYRFYDTRPFVTAYKDMSTDVQMDGTSFSLSLSLSRSDCIF